MTDIPTVVTIASVIVTSASVIASCVYYTKHIRIQNKSRETDTVLRLYAIYGSQRFQKTSLITRATEWGDYDYYYKMYSQDFEKRAAWLSVAAYFEGIGVLVHKGLIDISLIEDILSTPTITAWEKLEKLIKSERKSRNRPKIWEWFEYLYEEMRKRELMLQQSTT